MKTIQVQYFALLREQASTREETIHSEAETLVELYGELVSAHGFTLSPSQVKVSRNSDWVSLSDRFSDGDRLVFIPPVAGG